MPAWIPPLAGYAIAALSGMAVGLSTPGLMGGALIGAIAAFLLLLRGRGPGSGGAVVAIFGFAAAGIGLGAAAATNADCRYSIPDGATIDVRGWTEALEVDGAAVPFRLAAVRTAAGWTPCAAETRIRLPRQVKPLRQQHARSEGAGPAAPDASTLPGFGVRAVGQWRAPQGGRGAGLLIATAVGPEAELGTRRWIAIRGGIQVRLRQIFGERSDLAEALLVARREGIAPDVRDAFAASGLVHLLAISGSHVGLLIGVLLLLGGVARLSVRTTGAAAAAITVAYVLFLGAPHAAVRAALQVVLLMAAKWLQRPARPAALMAAAALFVTGLHPEAVLDAGAQLSFAGVAGILWLRPRLLPALRRAPAPIGEMLATSIAATLATSPLAAFHFGQVAPIGIVANLVALPLVGLIVPAAALSLLVSAVSIPVATFLAGGTGLLLDALRITAVLAAAVPWGHAAVARSAPVRLLVAVAIAACIVALLERIGGRRGGAARRISGPRRPLRPAVRHLGVAGCAVAVLIGWPTVIALTAARGTIQIHMIDVGQGDAFAIRSPRGRWLLVDAGPRSDRWDAGARTVVPYLRDRGANVLEALVLTHPDADHIGGAAAVMRSLRVRHVIDPGGAAGKAMFIELLRLADAEGIAWTAARAGESVEMDGVRLQMLYPGATSLDGPEDSNASSVVFRLEYGVFSALFLGDAPAEVERALVHLHGDALRSTVLKVGHHGSRTSTSQELLDVVRPTWGLVSLGRHNRFGHPAPEVVGRLSAAEVRLVRSDRVGWAVLSADASGTITIEGERCSSTGCYAP